MSWSAVALLVLGLGIFAIAQGLRSGFYFVLLFLVLGIASGLLPGIGLVGGVASTTTTSR